MSISHLPPLIPQFSDNGFRLSHPLRGDKRYMRLRPERMMKQNEALLRESEGFEDD
jgi:hypothetical protein